MEMDPKDIAKDAIKEPADPAAVDKGTVVNYLATPKVLEDFADVRCGRAHEKRTKTRA